MIRPKQSRQSMELRAAEIAELLEDRKVINFLIANLHRDLLRETAELTREIIELRADLAHFAQPPRSIR